MKATLQKRLARALALLVLWLILCAAAVKLIRQFATRANVRVPAKSRGSTARQHLRDELQRTDSLFRLTTRQEPSSAR
jgi:hypothetical protein